MATGRAAHQFSQTAPDAQIEVAETVAAVESPSTDVTTPSDLLMPFRSKST
jgi:hypothetical protein